jgi:hypothetical protein
MAQRTERCPGAVAAVLGAALLLAGCLGDEQTVSTVAAGGSSATTPGATAAPGGPAGGVAVTPTPTSSAGGSNRAPTIAGAPAGSVAPGNTYIFQPVALDPDHDLLTFSVRNLPAWARFDAYSGQIAGTPGAADVGDSVNVVVSVSDGRLSAALAPFTIRVGAGGGIVGSGTRTATIAWQAPQAKTDGSALASLSGYRIHYGSASRAYSNVVAVSDPALTRYVIRDLAPGTYYVAMTAVAADGLESDYSIETVARLN